MRPAPESWLRLARIRRTQGRKGEVFAEILTDFPEKFAERSHLWLVRERGSEADVVREADLTNHWLHKGGIVLHFAGVDSITAAEALAGLYVAIPFAQRAPLGEGEAYIGDLIGCQLVDLAGPEPSCVGAIEDVDRSAGPVPLLVVRGACGQALIPFAKSYLRTLDLEGRRVEMELPEGLVNLNLTESE